MIDNIPTFVMFFIPSSLQKNQKTYPFFAATTELGRGRTLESCIKGYLHCHQVTLDRLRYFRTITIYVIITLISSFAYAFYQNLNSFLNI